MNIPAGGIAPSVEIQPMGFAAKRPRSLRARAFALLARREFSRAELGRRLAPFSESAAEVEQLLDEFVTAGHLSEQRFADSTVRRRGERYGAARVVRELQSHHLPADMLADARTQLKQTELRRAHALWSKRFAAPPVNLAERAKQSRFLAARGFSGDTIRQVLGGNVEIDEVADVVGAQSPEEL